MYYILEGTRECRNRLSQYSSSIRQSRDKNKFLFFQCTKHPPKFPNLSAHSIDTIFAGTKHPRHIFAGTQHLHYHLWRHTASPMLPLSSRSSSTALSIQISFNSQYHSVMRTMFPFLLLRWFPCRQLSLWLCICAKYVWSSVRSGSRFGYP